MRDKCPGCGKEFKQLPQHWRGSPSHRPELTREQREIAIGLVMGDGHVNATSKNSRLNVQMINKEYLEYLDEVFGILSRGVHLKISAEDASKYDRESGWNEGALEENYSDKYRWTTSTHPEFNELRRWYDSGSKVWPDDIELTPTILKHWYVGDGTYANNCQFRISMVNERDNKEKVSQYFTNVGLPPVSNWTEFGDDRCSAIWNTEESKELFDYMGEPVDGFKYKWP